MYNPTNIMSGAGKQCIGYSYNECFIAATDMKQSGVDDINEHYILCRDTYEAVKAPLLDIHNKYSNSDVMAISTSVEYPVLMSSEHKYVIYMREEFGHYLLNTLANIANIHKSNPEAIFIVFTGYASGYDQDWAGKNRQKLVGFLIDFFSDNKILYYLVPSMSIVNNYGDLNNASGVHDKLELEHSKKTVRNYMIYKARNVTVVDSFANTMALTVKDIKTLIDQYINEHSANGTWAGKKIYITRGSSESETDPFIINEDSSIGYKDGKVRIYDENLLEQYLKDQGFEIVNFENLSSIRDQVQLMRSTSVILGATGTGLVNELFMEDGKILIELRVEDGSADTVHRIVPDYYDLSVSKQHLYFALDVPDKQATTAIKKLKNLLDSLNLDSLIDSLKKDLHL